MPSTFYWICQTFRCIWKTSMEETAVILRKACLTPFRNKLWSFTCFCNAMIFWGYLLDLKCLINFDSWLQQIKAIVILPKLLQDIRKIWVKDILMYTIKWIQEYDLLHKVFPTFKLNNLHADHISTNLLIGNLLFNQIVSTEVLRSCIKIDTLPITRQFNLQGHIYAQIL